MNDKGGVLGRRLELVVYDNGSDRATAVRLYEQLITQDKVDLVLGPSTSPITDPVADVTEKHKLPMVAPAAAATSIYRSPGAREPQRLPLPRGISGTEGARLHRSG